MKGSGRVREFGGDEGMSVTSVQTEGKDTEVTAVREAAGDQMELC